MRTPSPSSAPGSTTDVGWTRAAMRSLAVDDRREELSLGAECPLDRRFAAELPHVRAVVHDFDEQVQLAVERCKGSRQDHRVRSPSAPNEPRPVEDSASEWARVKSHLRGRMHPVAYANWIEQTCQLRRDGTTVLVWLPDPTTRDCIEQEYANLIKDALQSIGPLTVKYTNGVN